MTRPTFTWIELEIPFQVRGKARPRFNRATGAAYLPGSYRVNVQELRHEFRRVLFARPGFCSPHALYRVTIFAYRKRRIPRSKREQALLESTCPLGSFADGKPDVDNLLGTVMDAATLIVYPDDARVADAHVVKIWSDRPGARVRIEHIQPLSSPMWGGMP